MLLAYGLRGSLSVSGGGRSVRERRAFWWGCCVAVFCSGSIDLLVPVCNRNAEGACIGGDALVLLRKNPEPAFA